MEVEITDLAKSYGSATAVDGLDLTVREGELTTLLGPSGCGKTTTLRCIAGLELPDEGTIRIGDTVIDDAEAGVSLPTQERDVGFVFQTFDVWPHMTVFDNVAYPLQVRGRPASEIEQRVVEVLKMADIANLRSKPATDLSGGQQARVGLCRALVYKPKVLLCDEPLTGLDRNLRRRIRDEIKRIQSDLGITTVYVTHDQPEAMAISDRIVLMNTDGKIEQRGPPEEIYENPASRYALEFVGDSQTFTGTVSGTDTIDTDIGTVRCPDPGDPGTEVVLGVRPDDVHLTTDRAAGGESNEWTGRILNTYYFGDSYEFDIRVGDELLKARISDEDYAQMGLQFPEGRRVSVRLSPDDVFMFPTSSTRSVAAPRP